MTRRSRRPVTMKDVARRAGVDPSTVSRALRRNPWIPPWTRDRIKAVAAEMGYIRSTIASELAGVRSRTIGACIPRLGDGSIDEQLRGFDSAALGHGFKVLAAFYFDDEEREVECVEDFQERRVAGIIVFGTSSPGRYPENTPGGLCPIVVAPAFDPSCHRSDNALGRQSLDALLDLMRSET